MPLEIAALNETALRHFPPDNQYEKALSPYLAKWQAEVNEYVPRLLALCKPQKHTKIVILIDNVINWPCISGSDLLAQSKNHSKS